MYRSHYGLVKKPFQLSTDPKFLWLGEKHREALATLKYGVIDQKGFLLVSGDVGTGKTTLINALLESIEENTLVANITDPALDLIEFFNFVALSFNIPKKFNSKIDFIVYFSRFLKKVYSENKNVLLIIDEVHRLSKELLEHIRLLSNIELPDEKLINIFFVGQNEIQQTLALPECRALRQRISLVYQIEPLSENETSQYIKHRLNVAGTEENIFTQNAVQEIYNFSKGYPRLINTICDHSLLTGYVREFRKITPDIVNECAEQFKSIGETQYNIHPVSHDQHQPEGYTHSVTCPYVKDISENKGARIFALSQPESTGEHAKTEAKSQILTSPQSSDIRKTENLAEEAHNSIADGSKVSMGTAWHKKKFSWTPAISLATRTKKNMASWGSAALPFIKSTQKKLASWGSALVSFTKRIQKQTFSRVSAAGPFLNRMQKRFVSWFSEASLPNFFQQKRFLWMSAVSLALMILVTAGLYQKTSTKKNPSESTAFALKTAASAPDKPDLLLTSANVDVKAAIIPDHPTKIASSPKTGVTKPDVLEQAKTALQNKDFNRAIGLFEQAMAQSPKHATTIKKYYSNALQGQGNSVFKKDPNKAEILLSKAVQADPQNAKAYFDLGRLYTKSKDYPKAITAYQKAFKLSYRPSDVCYNLGFIYASTGDLANAEKMFLYVANLKPPYLDKVLFNLAVVQQKQGKNRQCIKNLEKAVINNPKNQRAQQYLNQLKKDERIS